MWEVKNETSWEKAAAGDQAYIAATWSANDEDVEMASASDEEEGGETEEEEVDDVLRSQSHVFVLTGCKALIIYSCR